MDYSKVKGAKETTSELKVQKFKKHAPVTPSKRKLTYSK